jgi:calcineurin-like phosphoesterase family protein
MKLILEKDQRLFFTSDTHYNHSNICRATTKWEDSYDATRDFKSLSHMNDSIVQNINDLVKENDVLIHMGDWSWGGFEYIEEFRKRIVCKNVHLVFGNHDEHIKKNTENIQDIFTSTHDYLHLDVRQPSSTNKGSVNKFEFICMHYPIASWDGLYHGTIHLHGHTHLTPNSRISQGKAMDVGVDGNEYKPLLMQEIIVIMGNREINHLCLPKDRNEKRI